MLPRICHQSTRYCATQGRALQPLAKPNSRALIPLETHLETRVIEITKRNLNAEVIEIRFAPQNLKQEPTTPLGGKHLEHAKLNPRTEND